MATKNFIITSFGLKNIVLNKYQSDDDFTFIFGEQEFRMNSFFAEFISPVVSHLHQTDPTINTINFGEINKLKSNEFNGLAKTVITPEIISLIQQISSGYSIEINEDQSIKLRFLSVLLGNEELHSKLNELFPPNYNEQNINSYLKNIECCYHFSRFKTYFDFNSLLSFVSIHFDQLNRDEFLKLPRYLQYQIISHPKLQIESEDSLFDIIIEIIERKNEAEEIDDVLFLEQIEFTGLNEDRLHTFVDMFDINEMSGQLWCKLCKCFFTQTDKKSTRISNRFLIVGGDDEYNLLGEKPNCKSDDGEQIISPPLKSSVDPSTLLSYSVCGSHSVFITNNGSLFGIGDNHDGRISNSLIKTEIDQFTEFSIKDNSGCKLTPISAVCSSYGTLYMLLKNNSKERQLVYCDEKLSYHNQVFLNIGNQQPVALFGGYTHVVAINSEGEIIFINRYSIINSLESKISGIPLPGGEKASSVACCNDSIVALSSSGRVFSSKIEFKNSILRFSEVKELSGEEIIHISGIYEHCFAVTREGRVFGRGSNLHGRLGLDKEIDSVSSFIEITSLRGHQIISAYAGCLHSLFETKERKLFSCGSNSFGELLLSSGPCENVYSPKETAINGNSIFCIAGDCLSAVFIGSKVPPNTPNIGIQQQRK